MILIVSVPDLCILFTFMEPQIIWSPYPIYRAAATDCNCNSLGIYHVKGSDRMLTTLRIAYPNFTKKCRNTDLFWGAFTEDIVSTRDSKRLQSLNQFIDVADLTTKTTKKTYVGPNGVELSTMVYIFYTRISNGRMLNRWLSEKNNSSVFRLRFRGAKKVNKRRSEKLFLLSDQEMAS